MESKEILFWLTVKTFLCNYLDIDQKPYFHESVSGCFLNCAKNEFSIKLIKDKESFSLVTIIASEEF